MLIISPLTAGSKKLLIEPASQVMPTCLPWLAGFSGAAGGQGEDGV